MKRTKKRVAALALVPQSLDPYSELQQRGYKWNSAEGQWQQRPAATNVRTGIVDLRLRAGTGEIEDVAIRVAEALKGIGWRVVRVSAPDPDDRNGPAVTARVYMQFVVN